MEKCIIVAVADNRAIGRAGGMPWHISEDFKYFKRTTMGCPVIMGRTTFISIGRPLPGRKNIVLSRSAAEIEGVTVVPDLEAAFAAAQPAERCFIIGGASVYSRMINEVDKLYVTHVHASVEDADAFFPEIDPAVWQKENVSETFTDPETGWKFEFVVYTRI